MGRGKAILRKAFLLGAMAIAWVQEEGRWLREAAVRHLRARRWIREARFFESRREVSGAILCLERVMALRPDCLWVKLALGRYYMQVLQFERAYACLRDFLDRVPSNAEGNFYLGVVLFYQGQSECAIGYLERAERDFRTEPGNEHARKRASEALLYLGRCYERLGKPEQAAVFFEEAARAGSRESLQCLLDLGERLIQTDPLQARALEIFRTVVRLDPQQARAWNDLGVCWVHRGEAEQGLACFECALTIDPAHAEARTNAQRVRDLLASVPAE